MARAIVTSRDCVETPIPQGAMAWWMGTVATIPAGWEICDGNVSANDPAYTRLDFRSNRYLKACALVGDSPGATGGAGTHTHTIASHNGHAQAAGGATIQCQTGANTPNSAAEIHTHDTMTAAADALSSANNDPLYMYGVPIVYTMPRGGTRGILSSKDFASSALPSWKLIFGWGLAASPSSGWSKCNGDTVNGVVTPNLLGKYLKGIPTTGTEPGTTGGANTHSHDVSHTHTSGNAAGGAGLATDTYGKCHPTHTHALASQDPTTDSPSNEPLYATIHYICFTGHGSSAAADARGLVTSDDVAANLLCPRGLTAIWMFSLASKPSTWGHCDGGAWANGQPTGMGASKPDLRSRYVVHTPDSATNGGGTGGNGNHTHTATGHSHTISGNTGSAGGFDSGGIAYATTAHTHAVASTTWASSPWTTANDPAYILAAFVVRD